MHNISERCKWCESIPFEWFRKPSWRSTWHLIWGNCCHAPINSCRCSSWTTWPRKRSRFRFQVLKAQIWQQLRSNFKYFLLNDEINGVKHEFPSLLVLVYRLRKMAEVNSFISDLNTQMEMARELSQTISSLLCCCILSKRTVREFITRVVRCHSLAQVYAFTVSYQKYAIFADT